jgi:hypothetical protein
VRIAALSRGVPHGTGRSAWRDGGAREHALRAPPCGIRCAGAQRHEGRASATTTRGGGEEGNAMKAVLAVVVMLGVANGVAYAQGQIRLDEIVGSWQGDDEIQYLELRMAAAGQNGLANAAAVIFDDAAGSAEGRRTAVFTQNVANVAQGAKILIASAKAKDLASIVPDFLLPAGYLRPKAGRVCYAVSNGSSFVPTDCVAYGAFTGDTGVAGPPTPVTPDNRVLRRTGTSGRYKTDWIGALDATLVNNAGASGALPATLCGDGIISQGEECDGKALGGASCASLGFAKGKLTCGQCHYDVDACTTCGNGAITGKEECDGADLGERTCDSLGYTGGTLACTDACKVTTAACEPVFFVPGGGPPKTDCLGEWRIMNATGGPNVKGKTAPRQTCKDGDAGCDADGAANGTCTFTVAACFSRADARFAKCPETAVSAWNLLGKVDPADPAVAGLVTAIGALGPSTPSGVTVSFAPALATADACSASVPVPVAVGQKRVLRARTDGPSGKPKDVDVLRLACTR